MNFDTALERSRSLSKVTIIVGTQYVNWLKRWMDAWTFGDLWRVLGLLQNRARRWWENDTVGTGWYHSPPSLWKEFVQVNGPVDVGGDDGHLFGNLTSTATEEEISEGFCLWVHRTINFDERHFAHSIVLLNLSPHRTVSGCPRHGFLSVQKWRNERTAWSRAFLSILETSVCPSCFICTVINWYNSLINYRENRMDECGILLREKEEQRTISSKSRIWVSNQYLRIIATRIWTCLASTGALAGTK